MRFFIVVLALIFGLAGPAAADCAGAVEVCDHALPGSAPLIVNTHQSTLWGSATELPGVARAGSSLVRDLARLSGGDAGDLREGRIIIIGTIGRHRVIDRLIAEHKLDVSDVAGHWEAYVQQVVERPMPGVERALVIAGADMRGTIYGMYDLSARMGVSPWAWWADVPAPTRPNLYITAGRRVEAPGVRYRGIFLNDEDPGLKGWATEKFGGLNHQFYEHVFDLILRLRGNYLWPAMWGKSLWDDDPQSADLASEMGIVLGTSHHEPLQRSHVEWERYGHGGAWDYTTNASALRDFWRQGMIRRGDHETIVTIGMRGDGDRPMTQGTAISLLERIVHDQREIIAQTTHRPAPETPQLWALYKEVQDYYDQGMRVPDDVTLLFSDDNWGNIRRLPTLGAAPRAGGYGVYYHFDYVGGPRNYKWINTNQIERVWEQMHLARAYGADRIWIVNVGDLKPMEFPISFFLDYAWNPEACDLECLRAYPSRWAAQQFGPEHADEIGELLTRYTQYNARRKPELIDPATFSALNFDEANRVAADWTRLAQRAEEIGAALPAADHDAYFQLVLYPILAAQNLNEMYVAAGLNRLYAQQGRISAAFWGQRAQRLFDNDAALTAQYHALGGGRWNHQMDQTHIGYTTWQQPDRNVMPALAQAARAPSAVGVSIEGDARVWPDTSDDAILPEISPFSATRSFTVFPRVGGVPYVQATVSAERRWLHVTARPEAVSSYLFNEAVDRNFALDTRYDISVDWERAPAGRSRVPITIRPHGARSVTIYADIFNPPNRDAIDGFVEANGYVAMEAMHYDRAVNANGLAWSQIANIGPSAGGVTAFPVTASAQTPGGDAPRLEYELHLFHAGDVQVQVTTAPSLDFRGHIGLRYAVSIDDGAPQLVDMVADTSQAAWNGWVAHNGNTQSMTLHVAQPGHHTLKLWLVNTGVVFERIVVATRPLPASYLGPPESMQASQIQWPARH